MRTCKILLTIVVIALLAGPFPTAAQKEPYWPTHGWRTSTPEAQGMDSALITKFLDGMVTGSDPFHSIVLIRHGAVVLDASPHPFSSAKQQAFRGSAEPVIATLVGIAIDKGYLKGVDQSIWNFLPKDKTANMDVDKAALTIGDFLTHRSGLDFVEFGDYDKYYPLGGKDASWVQTFLDAKMAAKPGTVFKQFYGDGLVLSAILQKATGTTALDFAKQNLFGSLGITDVTWLADPQGVTIGDDELYLSPLDMAKIAYLYLHDGQWEGKQVVSEGWAKKATSQIVTLPSPPPSDGFGWGWHVSSVGFFGQWSPGGEQFGAFPGLDFIYMVTGDTDFALEENWGNYLAPAIKESATLPENPDALARLNAKVQSLANPTPRDIAAAPDAFKAVSGKTYKLAENKIGWKTLAIDFGAPDSKEGTLTLGINDSAIKLIVGQDFVYRITPVGLPAQPGSGVYRLLGGLPWMTRLSWSPKAGYILMGDLMGREKWQITLAFSAENSVNVLAKVNGVVNPDNPVGPDAWSFSGAAS